MPGKKRKLLSVDAFLKEGLGSSGEESESTTEKVQKKQDKLKDTGTVKAESKGKESSKKKAVEHKASLQSLKEKDPEFYNFLKKEDHDLLEFNPDEISDSDDEEDSDNENGPGDKLPKLEVATDSEDEESDMEDGEKRVKKKVTKVTKVSVTLKMVNQWSKALNESNSLQALHQSVGAFKAAVLEAGNDDTDTSSRYRVEGTTVFNAIVRLCITDVFPMLTRLLKLPQKKDSQKAVLPSSSAKWKRVKIDVKSYLTDVLQFVTNIAEPGILNVILKHMYQLTTYFACFPKLTKQALKRLITIWSSGEETSRVLAFLCINRLTHVCQTTLLEFVIKHMYMAYVKNCKFTSPTTLPMINFMQRSLVEIFVLDVTQAYQFAFIYIRQLAIHLRNAITVKKKDTCQSVYNWQYIHSLHMWVRLLSQVYPNETLEPLIYPLTQVIIGTIKLVPTARYYPLRFHCVRALIMLSDATNTYIPTLPFLTQILRTTDFNKKYTSTSLKPFNFACILKLSKAQLSEKAFKDGVMDQVYELLLESFTINSHCVGFPELALPAIIQMKAFLKKSTISNYSKIIKQIVDKVQETSRVITQRRRSASLSLHNSQSLDAWERRSRDEGTPLIAHLKQYKKKRVQEVQLEIAGRDMISSENLPTVNRRSMLAKATKEEKEEFKGLFGADSDEESEEDSERFLLREERTKQTKQKPKKVEEEEDDSDSDMYSDFDDDEMEALDKSADEESEEEEENESDLESESEEDESEPESEEEVKPKQKTRKVKEAVELEGSDDEDVVEDFNMSDYEEED